MIGNLDRNDMSYVPATTVKNGKTLSLANVEWQVTGTALVGEALVPAQYQAVATYSASSSYQAATGYVTTAEYHGTVTSEGVDSITYTVVYTGSEIVPVKTHIWDNGNLAAPLLIIAAVLLCAGIAAAALILMRRRKNVYVYVPDSKPREYRLIAKFRVEPDSEVPAIDVGALTLNPGDTVAVEVKNPLPGIWLGASSPFLSRRVTILTRSKPASTMTGMNLPFPLKKNRRLPYEEVFLIDFDSGCHAFCDGGQRTGCRLFL